MPDEFLYQLVWSRKAQDALEQLRSQGIEPGEIYEMDLLVIAINSLLRERPLALGTIYRSSGGIEEHQFAKGILLVDFAVDVQRQFVLVRGCWRVSVEESNGTTNLG